MNTNETKLLEQTMIEDRELLMLQLKQENAKATKEKRLSIAKRIASIFGVVFEFIIYLSAIIPMTHMTIFGNITNNELHDGFWVNMKENFVSNNAVIGIFSTFGLSVVVNITWLLITLFTFWLISIVIIDIVNVIRETISASKNIVGDITGNVKSGLDIDEGSTSIVDKVFAVKKKKTKVKPSTDIDILNSNSKTLDDIEEDADDFDIDALLRDEEKTCPCGDGCTCGDNCECTETECKCKKETTEEVAETKE